MGEPPEIDDATREQVALAEVMARPVQDPAPLVQILQRTTPESAPADVAGLLGCSLEQAISVLNAQMRIFTAAGAERFTALARSGRQGAAPPLSDGADPAAAGARGQLESLDAIGVAAADPMGLLDAVCGGPGDETETRVAKWCRCSHIGARAVSNMRLEALIPSTVDRVRRIAEEVRSHLVQEPQSGE